MHHPVSLALAACLLGIAACGRVDHVPTVRARASGDLSCPSSSVIVSGLGGGGYRARGCGRVASYVCSVQQAGRYGRAHEICVLESGPSGPPAGSGPEGWSDDEVAALAARVQDDVMACLPPSRADLELPVVLTTTGELRRLGNTVGPGPSACVDRVLSAVRLEQGREERSMVLRLARTTAGGESRPARATSPGDPAQAARAAVDGRARALLACTGEDAMALEVSWARDGRLDGAPRGVRPGSPEAECVRGILRGLRIGARGASGSTLHAIQR